MKTAVADEEDEPNKKDESPESIRSRQLAAMRELFNSPLVKAITVTGSAGGQGYNADQAVIDEVTEHEEGNDVAQDH